MSSEIGLGGVVPDRSGLGLGARNGSLVNLAGVILGYRGIATSHIDRSALLR